MRRTDRQVNDNETIKYILSNASCCHLAFSDGAYPYIVALNYGYRFENGHITLYFHGAGEGRKADLIRKNGRASFFTDTAHRLIDNEVACKMTMEFMSIYGTGNIAFIEDTEQKIDALSVITEKYTAFKDNIAVFSESMVKNTAVFKLECDFFTAKKLIKQEEEKQCQHGN